MDERGGFYVFPSQFFCITVSKNYIGNRSFFQKNCGSESFYQCEGGFHVFPSTSFSLTLPKTFIVNSSVFQKISGSGKIA